MEARDIQAGHEYAIREPLRSREPLQRVRIIERARTGKWKAEWIDPNPGLVDYVKSANIVVPWGKRKQFLADERRHDELARLAKEQWDGQDGPVTEAVNIVFEASGEDLSVWREGILTYDAPALERVAARAGVEPPEHPLGYCDRSGQSHLPFDVVLELARAFAAAEPNTVLSTIDAMERRYMTEMRTPGESHLVPLVNRWRAAWALARQWAGHDAAIAARESEIEDLRRLVERTIWDLRRPGVEPERVALKLERAISGG